MIGPVVMEPEVRQAVLSALALASPPAVPSTHVLFSRAGRFVCLSLCAALLASCGGTQTGSAVARCYKWSSAG